MRRPGRAIAAAVVGVLVLGLAAGSDPFGGHPAGGGGAAAARDRVTGAPDTATAVPAAMRQKAPVLVTGETTGTRAVYAQPDGTLRAVLSTRPVRVQRGNSWVPVDLTLTPRTDGSVAPRATETELTLSGGGAAAPLVRYGRQGAWLALSWPGPLPKPVLDGAVATYRGVLPGVDLVIEAQADGYAQRLVVKDAAAARDPALAAIRLGLTTHGVTVRTGPDGSIEAVDGAGTVVFEAPPSAMWDTSGHTAVAGVAVDAGSLTLRPDRALLADPHARYPVTVDPSWATAARVGWAKVFSGLPNSTEWNGGPDGAEAKSGLCAGWPDCNGIGVARTYFQYDTGFLNGRKILSASVNTTIVHSPDCEQRQHQLYFANAPIGPGTTWANAPTGIGLEAKNADVDYNGCLGYKPLGFDVTTAINPTGLSTYFLRAVNEGDNIAWRRLDAIATNLVVNFDTAPNAPYDMSTDPPLKAPCRWCGGVSWFGDRNIRLRTRLSDPDNDLVHPIWDFTGGGAAEHRDNGPTQASGAVFDTQLDLTGRDGQTVSWTVWGSDGTLGGPLATGPGPFHVDETGISTRPGVSARLYKQDNRWHGGVGVPDQFTFDAAGVSDVDHYLYGWQDPPTTQVDATSLGGPATVTLKPPGDGPRDLYVQSVDRAGHKSPTTAYHFYVRAGNGPYAQWAFEGNAEDGAFLGDHDGTLNGDASYAVGAVGSGVRVSGAGSVTAPTAVRTDTSFSVSAWVKVDEGGIARAAVSQDGTRNPGFDLWYRPENGGKWVFGVGQSDSGDAGAAMAWSADPAQLGVWTHLTGVYDAPLQRVKLYVNGVLSGTATKLTPPWQAGGNLRIGQTIWSGGLVDNWLGSLDEVHVYDRVLTDAEVKATVTGDAVQVGYWKLDDDRISGTAVNAVQGGDMGVLSDGGAGFVPDGAVDGGLTLDGSQGSVSTGRPEFRTDQSFSVAAWVKLDAGGTARAAISQDGTNYSGFDLWYRPENGGKWVFGMALADSGTGGASMAWSADPAQLGVWTHLVGVYDAPGKQLRLYVNGVLSGTATQVAAPWNATGPFHIGQGRWNGNPSTDHWQGTLDEVRAYSRVISAEEIRGLVGQSKVAVGDWRFDGNAADSSGRGLNGTLNGGADWAGGQTANPDPTDLALHLNGNDAYVSAPHAVDTSRSFSVSAWVRPDKLGSHGGVVTQDGTHSNSFRLELKPDGTWAFTMYTQDVNGGGTVHDTIGGAAQPGVWAHLTGIYDADTGQLQLYVNGDLVASKAHSNAWTYAGGKLEIGRSQWNGGAVDYFPGAIDDVRIYTRTLFADEIRQMAGRDLSLIHQWAMDESSGGNAYDAVGALPAALSGGASFTQGRVGNAVALDGTAGAATTGALDVRTDASFTVSSWVYLDADTCDLSSVSVCKVDAVTVDGANTSKFRLGHVTDDDQNLWGAWTFEMPVRDGAGEVAARAVVTTEPTEVGRWTHLVGVYDATARKIWLYVNGIRVGDSTFDTPWNASGGLAIGRGEVSAQPTEYWPGEVDDVRLYTGTLDKDRIGTLYRSYPAEQGPRTLAAADAGSWQFDEGTGSTVADSTGNGHDLTLAGTTSWTGGRSGTAGWLDGTTGYAQTAGPVVTTSASFTVSAWAYMTSLAPVNGTVVAQEDTRNSAFALTYNSGNDKWSVFVTGSNTDNPNMLELDSAEPAAVGVWTHLAVVYDAGLRELRLYVNGMLSSARFGVSTWNATGPFTVGRGKLNGSNVTFFPRGIDDVRAYSSALSDGEVRRIHDEGGAPVKSAWRFDDGTGRDYANARHASATVSGGAGFTAGVSGKALQLDGTSGAAVTTPPVVDTRDSFTVSAWARLSRTDQIATVASQDGGRMSGFVLQYRPENGGRWVFGAPTSDSDGAALVYAASVTPPKAGEWTHLTGVYDYAARQLRLYVNGQLAGANRGNVALWPATGGFTIGRGRFNGEPDQYFPGAIDEVVANQGALPEDQIARRGGWAAPLGGQLGRYVNASGEHYTGSTDAPVRAGYHFEATLGTLVPSPRDKTRTLYACVAGADTYTSTDPACDGQSVIGAIGAVYTQPPTNVATVPVYRCATATDRFDSRQADCGGVSGATNQALLGYALAYAQLARYRYNTETSDHSALIDGSPPGYLLEQPLGVVSLVAQSGTQPLSSCLAGIDQFVSPDPACEGQVVQGSLGQVWAGAPTGDLAGQPTQPIYRCQAGSDHFVSTHADCEGQTVEASLGSVLTAVPDLEPIF